MAPMHDPVPHFVILGAGVAGLATAYHLARRAMAEGQAAPRLTLVEAADRPGGLAISLTRDGIVTDLGPHRLHTELPEIAALLSEVAEEKLLTVRRESHMYWLGQRMAYPARPLELLRRLGPVRTARLAGGAALAKVGLSGAPREGDTFERVMRERFGGPLWTELLAPYSAKVWKMAPDEIHGDIARVRISAGGIGELVRRLWARGAGGPPRETALRSFRYPKGGLQTLVDLLVDKVRGQGAELVLGAPLERIETSTRPDGRRRIERVVAGGREWDAPTAVVSTIPLPTLGDILGSPWRAPMQHLDYLAIRLVVVVVRRDRITRDNWLYFFDEGDVLNRAYEAKNFDPDLAPPGFSALTCEVTCRRGDETWQMAPEELTRRVISALVRNGLFGEEEVDRSFCHPVDWAYPIYQLDYKTRLEDVYGQLRRIENLLTCGRQGLYNHNNTDHSMAMGMAAADTLLAGEEGAADRWYRGLIDRFSHFRIVD
jgi:protoporphyrinogen oxidase